MDGDNEGKGKEISRGRKKKVKHEGYKEDRREKESISMQCS